MRAAASTWLEEAERLTRKLGELLIDAGYRIVTGGMGGVMEAACIGAKTSKNYREGDTIASASMNARATDRVTCAISTALGFSLRTNTAKRVSVDLHCAA